jgi:hypothetical protein
VPPICPGIHERFESAISIFGTLIDEIKLQSFLITWNPVIGSYSLSLPAFNEPDKNNVLGILYVPTGFPDVVGPIAKYEPSSSRKNPFILLLLKNNHIFPVESAKPNSVLNSSGISEIALYCNNSMFADHSLGLAWYHSYSP